MYNVLSCLFLHSCFLRGRFWKLSIKYLGINFLSCRFFFALLQSRGNRSTLVSTIQFCTTLNSQALNLRPLKNLLIQVFKVRNNKWTLFKHGHLVLLKSWIKNHFEWFYVRMKNFEKRLVIGFISSLLDHGGYFSEDELSIGQEQENYHSQEVSGHLHFFLVLALWP